MSRQILIIDDEADFRDAIKEILSADGYQVDESPYLATAVGTALSGNHDLIILDLKMPGLDGLELARLFKSQTPNTPILIISGYLTDTVPEQLRELGIHHVLPKPSSISQLFKAVEKAILS